MTHEPPVPAAAPASPPSGIVVLPTPAGAPRVGLRWFRASEMKGVLFALLWNAWLVGWFLEAFQRGKLDQALFGIPFLLLGLGMLYSLAATFLNTSWFEFLGRRLRVEHGPVPAGGGGEHDTTGWISLYAAYADRDGRRRHHPDSTRLELRAQKANFQEVVLATNLYGEARVYFLASTLAGHLGLPAHPLDPEPDMLPPQRLWGGSGARTQTAGIALDRLQAPDYEDELDDPAPDPSALGTLGTWLVRSGWLAAALAFGLACAHLPPGRIYELETMGGLLALCLVFGALLTQAMPLALGEVADSYVGLLRRLGWLSPPVSAKVRASLPAVEARGDAEGVVDQGFPVTLAPWPGSAAERARKPLVVAMWMPPFLAAALWLTGAPPLGMVAAGLALAGVLAAAHAVVVGDSLFRDAEALVQGRRVTKDRDIPLQLRLTAARDLRIEGIELRLDRRHIEWKEWQSHEGKGRRLIRQLEWEEGPTVKVPLSVSVERHQEVRLLTKLRLPMHFPLDQRRGFQRSNWVLQAHVDVPGWPDAAFHWEFAEVVAPETLEEASPAAPPRMRTARAAHESAARCPFCGDAAGTRALVACQSCETLHHADCWTSAGQCTTYACGEVEAQPLTLLVG